MAFVVVVVNIFILDTTLTDITLTQTTEIERNFEQFPGATCDLIQSCAAGSCAECSKKLYLGVEKSQES